MANITTSPLPEEKISSLLSILGQPARIQILLIIGAQEACVCHLEAVTGIRQASISQHLMVLRQTGWVENQRNGQYVFYRLCCPEVLSVLRQFAQLAGVEAGALERLGRRPVSGCPCPQCNPGIDPKLTCRKLNPNP